MHHQTTVDGFGSATSLPSLGPNTKNESFNVALSAAERSLNTEGGLDKRSRGQLSLSDVCFPNVTLGCAASTWSASLTVWTRLPSTLHTSASPPCLHTRRQAGSRRDAALEGFSRQAACKTKEETLTFVPNLQFRGSKKDLLNLTILTISAAPIGQTG